VRQYLFNKLTEYNDESYQQTIIDGENFVKDTSLPVCIVAGAKDENLNIEHLDQLEIDFKHSASARIMLTHAGHDFFIHDNYLFMKIHENFMFNVAPGNLYNLKQQHQPTSKL